MPHHVFSYKHALWRRDAETARLFICGDIVLHISCFECVLFSSNITFHNERLSDELEFKSHMLLLSLGGEKTSLQLLILLETSTTVISGVKLSFILLHGNVRHIHWFECIYIFLFFCLRTYWVRYMQWAATPHPPPPPSQSRWVPLYTASLCVALTLCLMNWTHSGAERQMRLCAAHWRPRAASGGAQPVCSIRGLTEWNSRVVTWMLIINSRHSHFPANRVFGLRLLCRCHMINLSV